MTTKYKIKNLKPITEKFSILPPYLTLLIEKEHGQYVVSYETGNFSIKERDANKKKAIHKVKRGILFVFLDLRNDPKVEKIFGDSASQFKELIVTRKKKLQFIEEQKQNERAARKQKKINKLNKMTRRKK